MNRCGGWPCRRFSWPGGIQCPMLSQAQTNITAHGGSFYLLEPPETEMEIAVKAELKELKGFREAQCIWGVFVQFLYLLFLTSPLSLNLPLQLWDSL